MKSIKAILYSLYARIFWALAGLITGLITGVMTMYALGGTDKGFRRYVNDRWKS